MVLIASAAILYVLYVHYYSDEDLTLEGISPRLARAIGPHIAHHCNVLLNPRLAIEGVVDVHRLQLERDPNNGTEEGDEEIFSDFQSASNSSSGGGNSGSGVRRRVVEFMGWNDENYRGYDDEEDEEENTGLLTGVHYSRSSSTSTSSQRVSSNSLVQRGRFRRRTTDNNDPSRQEGEEVEGTSSELAGPTRTPTKFVGIKTWAKYVKQRYQEEVQNEKDLLAKEWKRFRSSYRNETPEEEEEEKKDDDDERRGGLSEDISVCPTATELKTFTSASLRRNGDIQVEEVDGESDDDSYDLSYPTASTEEETTSNDTASTVKRDNLDTGFPSSSYDDDDEDTEGDLSKDDDQEEQFEDVDLQNMDTITNNEKQQQHPNSPTNEKEKHLLLLKQTLQQLEQSRRSTIISKGPNDMKVATISRKAGLLSIKFGQIDRGMLLLREYVRIRTQNIGYEFDLELAHVLYTLGDFYCQQVTVDLGQGKFELKVEKEIEGKKKQRDALGKARRCWTGALRIYRGVGLEESHARVCNLKYKIERVEKGQKDIHNSLHYNDSLKGAREQMAKLRSWVGTYSPNTSFSDEKILRRGEDNRYIRHGSVSVGGAGGSCGTEVTQSANAAVTRTTTTGQPQGSISREEDLNWC